jgi:hypothetical protein
MRHARDSIQGPHAKMERNCLHDSVATEFRYAHPLICEVMRTAHYSSQRASRGNVAIMETNSNRIRHIIVVIDPSAGMSQAAVDKAAILACRLNASMELLICDIETAHEDDLIRLGTRRAPNSTEFFDQLDQLAAPLRADGIDDKGRTIYGNSLHGSLLSRLAPLPSLQ